MIGVLTGDILFSDGQEALIQTAGGIGYQIYCNYIFPEGENASVFVSHVIRESAETLYAFRSLREKKLFELMTTVKGVGPKSAYSIVSQISIEQIITAVSTEQKSILTKISGVGVKAASQIILDLTKKIHKITMYSSEPLFVGAVEFSNIKMKESKGSPQVSLPGLDGGSDLSESSDRILSDTILACENLGFQTDKVVPLAQRILKENSIKKPEQLVHLVLKEI